jgi:hypothetical protein
VISTFFLVVVLAGLAVTGLLALPRGALGLRPIYDAARCRDCGIRTRGGPRCFSCADQHVETSIRWTAFCQVWTQIGIAAYRVG